MDTIMVVYHILSLTPTKRPLRPLALLSTQRNHMPGFSGNFLHFYLQNVLMQSIICSVSKLFCWTMIFLTYASI